MEIVLASASPRRRELLSLITEHFTVCPPMRTKPCGMRRSARKSPVFPASRPRLCRRSTRTPCASARIPWSRSDGLRLGKPKDADEAASMLRRLRGRTHEVLTGLAVLTPDGGAHTLHTCTRVTFRDFAEDELAAYLATGEPLDKAGAYGIQGYGALLIKGIEGDYYSVMGLPVAPLYTILRDIHAV